MDYSYPRFAREVFIDAIAFHGGPKPGEAMPDFDLPTTDGGHVRKSDFVGNRPLLLTFGSITCPMTASADPALKRLHEDYGDRVAFVTLYVREAHPGANFPQPETFHEKFDHARAYKSRLSIPWPVAVDNLAGDLHRALDPRGNAAYLMDTNGNVAFRTLWSSDESGLRRAIEAVLSHPGQPVGQRQPLLAPMLAGMGVAYDTIDSAGPDAKRNWLQAVPPVYALARIAALFRPLPPLWRSVAAIATSAVGMGVAAAGIRSLLKRRNSGY